MVLAFAGLVAVGLDRGEVPVDCRCLEAAVPCNRREETTGAAVARFTGFAAAERGRSCSGTTTCRRDAAVPCSNRLGTPAGVLGTFALPLLGTTGEVRCTVLPFITGDLCWVCR